MRVIFDIPKEDLAEAIAELDHSEIIGLVLEVLSQCATVELDEELVARMWQTIAACYDEEEKPTLEDLMRRYAARAPPPCLHIDRASHLGVMLRATIHVSA